MQQGVQGNMFDLNVPNFSEQDLGIWLDNLEDFIKHGKFVNENFQEDNQKIFQSVVSCINFIDDVDGYKDDFNRNRNIDNDTVTKRDLVKAAIDRFCYKINKYCTVSERGELIPSIMKSYVSIVQLIDNPVYNACGSHGNQKQITLPGYKYFLDSILQENRVNCFERRFALLERKLITFISYIGSSRRRSALFGGILGAWVGISLAGVDLALYGAVAGFVAGVLIGCFAKEIVRAFRSCVARIRNMNARREPNEIPVPYIIDGAHLPDETLINDEDPHGVIELNANSNNINNSVANNNLGRNILFE